MSNTPTDPLGYDVYARTLWTRIQAALNKDQNGQALGDDPLVVGIFGEWGAGKSHLLKRMLWLAQNEAAQKALWRKSDGGFDLTVPVFFQPWKYEHEEHLLVPLMLHIYNDLRKALKSAQSREDIADETLKASYATTLSEVSGHLPEISEFVEHHFGDIVESIRVVLGDLIPGLGVASKLLPWALKRLNKSTQEKNKPSARINTGMRFENNGRHYYEIHESFKAITRPDFADQAALKSHLKFPVRINFVIFIDDLDRCLPEKAVQTLELIKTVFNVESFAFVLALDDEVIERGIGHRYKEYKLQDKKPEMPITGFEYLEKIVHLPFRLPALTRQQAERFVADIEAKIQTAPAADLSLEEKAQTDARLFFRYGYPYPGTPAADKSDTIAERPTLYLRLLLDSFDHYVPRKLIRAVELMYQVERVANEKGKGWNVSRDLRRKSTESLQSGGDAMGRHSPPSELFHAVLFGLLLLQLFQPEVFRLVRRKEATLVSLVGTFVGKDKKWDAAEQVSEVDLWQWACRYDHPANRNGIPDGIKAPQDWVSSIGFLAVASIENKAERSNSQQVRLPLVQRLTEHMQVERHAFSPFKWAKALADLLGEQGVRNLHIRDYTQYLSEQAADAVSVLVGVGSTGQAQTTVARAEVLLPQVVIDNICDRMVSQDLGVQGELRKVLEPYQGQVFDAASSQKLLQKLQNTPNATLPILQGLADVAPHIHPERDGPAFWALVEPLGKQVLPDPNTPNETTPDPAKASLYLDVRSMLGQDKRFDPVLFYLWTRKNPEDAKEAPALLNNFVHFRGGAFTSGHKDEGDNQENPKADAGRAFYMARTLTTVDQFCAFVDDDGYKKPKLWHPQGRLWLSGDWDKAIEAQSKDKELPGWLKNRPKDMRQTPMGWDAQKRVGSRAVHSLCWFEAHAYAAWLTARLGDRLKIGGQQYIVTLPNELQWELAARGPQPQRWPWGDDIADAAKRANIADAGIGHASVPGCFAPNAAGLLDMTGNLWEWQNNFYQVAGKTERNDRLRAPGAEPVGNGLQVSGDWEADDLIALRGGSWINVPRIAACSYRYGDRAGGWLNFLGFRVMLSLAKNES